MSSGDTGEEFCLCRLTEAELDEFQLEMIQCEGCAQWYHGECIGVAIDALPQDEEYFCGKCPGGRAFLTPFDNAPIHTAEKIRSNRGTEAAPIAIDDVVEVKPKTKQPKSHKKSSSASSSAKKSQNKSDDDVVYLSEDGSSSSSGSDSDSDSDSSSSEDDDNNDEKSGKVAAHKAKRTPRQAKLKAKQTIVNHVHDGSGAAPPAPAKQKRQKSATKTAKSTLSPVVSSHGLASSASSSGAGAGSATSGPAMDVRVRAQNKFSSLLKGTTDVAKGVEEALMRVC